MKWYSVDEKPIPRDGRPVLVRLDDWKKGDKNNKRIQVGYFNKEGVSQIGFHFEFDLPKVTHWAEITDIPEQKIS